MRVLIGGASGLIGSELTTQLEAAGHEVLKLVRRQPTSPGEHHWAPAARMIDFTLMDRADAVVNLSGATLSRAAVDEVLPAAAPVVAARRHAHPDGRDEDGRESPGGVRQRVGGRLSTVTGPVRSSPSPRSRAPDSSPTSSNRGRPPRISHRRRRASPRCAAASWSGDGGAMKPLLPLAKLGLLGPIGGGGQHWPWISLRDEAAAIVHLLTSSKLSGPVNLVGPTPATADVVLRALAKAVHRPYGLPLPEKVVELALRDAGQELLLSSQKVVPQKLLDDGFVFTDRTVQDAMSWLVAPPSGARSHFRRAAPHGRAGWTRASPSGHAGGRRRRRRRGRAGTRRASSSGAPSTSALYVGKSSSAASRNGRPLARCGSSSTGSPPSASRIFDELLGSGRRTAARGRAPTPRSAGARGARHP